MTPRFASAFFAAAAALAALVSPASSNGLAFGDDLHAAGWRELTFRKFAATQYRADDEALGVVAEKSSSMLYRTLASERLSPSLARWSWRVDEGVGATDLTRKGGDDSALALYFVFADEKTANRLAGKKPSMLRMLGARNTTTLVYIFGGAKAGPFKSPYVAGRSWSMVLRPAMSVRRTWFDERIDLAGDHARAFGAPPQRLIAVAVSSDSDDTGGRNVAFLRGLAVE
ncbi:MAG: DUF3047 domain-containing protein [Parvularculaceae bacterium]